MEVSLLFCTWNRASQLSMTLRRLRLLTQPDEIVVVDDSSTDNTRQVVKEAQGWFNFPVVKYIFRGDKVGWDNCAIPRNIGIRSCAYEYVVAAEPECLFVTDVIKQLKEKARIKPDSVIMAGVRYGLREDSQLDNGVIEDPQHYIDHVWDVKEHPFHPSQAFDEDGKPFVYTSATVMRVTGAVATFVTLYKKEWLFEIGGWDEDFALVNGGGGWGWEDIDLLTRLMITKHHHIVDQDIKVLHLKHPPGPTSGSPRNEAIFRAKKFLVSGTPKNPAGGWNMESLVANQGREWGKL